MSVTGLANLAVKVKDLDDACRFYEEAGAEVRDRMEWGNGERADVFLGPVMITLFTRAIYEDAVELPAEGFLHPALFTDDLDTELTGHDPAHRLRRGPRGDPAGVHGAAGPAARPRRGRVVGGSAPWSTSSPSPRRCPTR